MKKTAYIFMEFQKEFLAESGKLNVKKEGSDFLKNSQEILCFARENDQPIFHVHLSFSPKYDELRQDVEGVLALVKQSQAFQYGFEGVEPIEEFLPKDNEICLKKNTISAFTNTNLEEQLKQMGITDLVFTGLLTNVCIESSVRDAYDKGYRVIVIDDATATIDEKSHEYAVKNVLPLFSVVCSTKDFIQNK